MEKDAAPGEEMAPPVQPPQAENGFLQQPKEVQPPVPSIWMIVLAGIALLGALAMLLMRRLAAKRWRGK
jgi:hypothetical protein